MIAIRAHKWHTAPGHTRPEPASSVVAQEVGAPLHVPKHIGTTSLLSPYNVRIKGILYMAVPQNWGTFWGVVHPFGETTIYGTSKVSFAGNKSKGPSFTRPGMF